MLPVHDSLIVPASEVDQTAEIMRRAFAIRFPHAACEVRVKKSRPKAESAADSLIRGAPDCPIRSDIDQSKTTGDRSV